MKIELITVTNTQKADLKKKVTPSNISQTATNASSSRSVLQKRPFQPQRSQRVRCKNKHQFQDLSAVKASEFSQQGADGLSQNATTVAKAKLSLDNSYGAGAGTLKMARKQSLKQSSGKFTRNGNESHKNSFVYESQSKETLPPRTIDEDQEDEIIKLLELEQRQRLEIDPMKELEEALMDRTTASLNRKQRITSINTNSFLIKEVPLLSKESNRESEDSSVAGECKMSDCSDSSPILADVCHKSQGSIKEFMEPFQRLDAKKIQTNLKSFSSTNNQSTSPLHNQETCSTNVTDETFVNGLNGFSYVNKRSLKSYQKKKILKSGSKNDEENQGGEIQSDLQISFNFSNAQDMNNELMMDSEGKKIIEIQQTNNVQQLSNNLINIQNQEEEKLFSQRNLSDIKQRKFEDTPQSNIPTKLRSPNNSPDQKNDKDINLFKDKNDWARQQSLLDLQLMNQFIKPLPLFKSHNSGLPPLLSFGSTANQAQQIKLIKDGNNLSHQSNHKQKQLRLKSENINFKNLSRRMLNLSNMINFMHAAQMQQLYLQQAGLASKQGLAGGVQTAHPHQIQSLVKLHQTAITPNTIIQKKATGQGQSVTQVASPLIECGSSSLKKKSKKHVSNN